MFNAKLVLTKDYRITAHTSYQRAIQYDGEKEAFEKFCSST